MSRSAVGSRSSDRCCAFTPTQRKPRVGHRRGVPPSDGRLQTANRRSRRRISRAKGKSLALGAALRHAGRQAIAERGDPLDVDRQPAPWGRAARPGSSTAPGPIGNSSRALERRESIDRPRESRCERNAHAWRIEAAADHHRCRALAGPRRVRRYAGMDQQGRAPSPAGGGLRGEPSRRRMLRRAVRANGKRKPRRRVTSCPGRNVAAPDFTESNRTISEAFVAEEPPFMSGMSCSPPAQTAIPSAAPQCAGVAGLRSPSVLRRRPRGKDRLQTRCPVFGGELDA